MLTYLDLITLGVTIVAAVGLMMFLLAGLEPLLDYMFPGSVMPIHEMLRSIS